LSNSVRTIVEVEVDNNNNDLAVVEDSSNSNDLVAGNPNNDHNNASREADTVEVIPAKEGTNLVREGTNLVKEGTNLVKEGTNLVKEGTKANTNRDLKVGEDLATNKEEGANLAAVVEANLNNLDSPNSNLHPFERSEKKFVFY